MLLEPLAEVLPEPRASGRLHGALHHRVDQAVLCHHSTCCQTSVQCLVQNLRGCMEFPWLPAKSLGMMKTLG